MLRMIEEGPARVSWHRALTVVCWVAVVLIPVAIELTFLELRAGVEVIFVNRSPSPMRDVVIHVTGVSYRVGEFAIDQTVRHRVRATSESHLEIEFKDSSGKHQREIVECYIEPNYSGSIEVVFLDGAVRIEDHIKHSIWY